MCSGCCQILLGKGAKQKKIHYNRRLEGMCSFSWCSRECMAKQYIEMCTVCLLALLFCLIVWEEELAIPFFIAQKSYTVKYMDMEALRQGFLQECQKKAVFVPLLVPWAPLSPRFQVIRCYFFSLGTWRNIVTWQRDVSQIIPQRDVKYMC